VGVRMMGWNQWAEEALSLLVLVLLQMMMRM
jgi:hypothetical protein